MSAKEKLKRQLSAASLERTQGIVSVVRFGDAMIIEWTNGECTVEDRQSLDGVYVNDHRISRPEWIHEGDSVRLGVSEIEWRPVGRA